MRCGRRCACSARSTGTGSTTGRCTTRWSTSSGCGRWWSRWPRRATRAWDRRRCWASDGSRSPRARLAREAHCSETSAGRAVGLAAKLEAMPLVAAALAEGKISVDHAWRLAVARTAHRAPAFTVAEETLVAIAVEEADFAEFLRAVQYWEQGADDQIGASPEQHRRHRAGRKAHHSRTFQGTWKLDATFDAVDGEIVDTALGRIYVELLEEEWAEIRAEHGDAATSDLLPRTNQQRRADALVEMATPGDGRGPGGQDAASVDHRAGRLRAAEGPHPGDLQRQRPHHPPGRRPPLRGRRRAGRVRARRTGSSSCPRPNGSSAAASAGSSRSATATANTPAAGCQRSAARATTSSRPATAARPPRPTATSSAAPTTANAGPAARPHPPTTTTQPTTPTPLTTTPTTPSPDPPCGPGRLRQPVASSSLGQTWNCTRCKTVSSWIGSGVGGASTERLEVGLPGQGEVLVRDRRERQELDVVDLDHH